MVSVEADYVWDRRVLFMQKNDPFLTLAVAASALWRVAFHIRPATWGLQPAVGEQYLTP